MDYQEVFVCDCACLSHQLWVGCYEEIPQTFFHLKLNTGGFFKRCARSFRYIFGFKSRFGEFDELLLSKEQTKKLIEVLKTYYETMA